MRAAVCSAFGEPLVVEDVTLDPPGPGEVTVRVDRLHEDRVRHRDSHSGRHA